MTEQNTTPQWQREFPDFPAADMPAIPAGFADKSWHNDACPSFYDEELGLSIWIGYADPDRREVPGPRFIIERQADLEDSPQELLSSDDWREILTAIKIRCTEYEREIGRA